MIRWRTEAEGRINCIKRDDGLPTNPHGHPPPAPEPGPDTGISAHNLTKIAGLTG